MKSLVTLSLALFMFSSLAMIKTDLAVEKYLENEFKSIDSIGGFIFLGETPQCDEVVDTYVVGDMGSGQTAFNCNICVLNDGGIATVDGQESFCDRED
jgi:hypothetical protein